MNMEDIIVYIVFGLLCVGVLAYLIVNIVKFSKMKSEERNPSFSKEESA